MKKKMISVLLTAGLLAGTLAGSCITVSAEEKASDKIAIGALKGPTAMGMAQLLDDDSYDFTIAASPDEIVPQIVQGNVDIAAVPSNLAAVLYQKTQKNVSVLAVNTLGVLYLVENGESIQSVEDLKGKTIYASGKGATPEYALEYVLSANGIDPEKDVTIEYKSEHAEVVAALANDQTAAGLLPQPFVTTALMKNDSLRVALDLNQLWQDGVSDDSQLVTGVVVVRNDYLKEHEADVDAFMDAYQASVEFVNSDPDQAAKIIGAHDIIAEEVAKKAIPDCSIVFVEGEEMQTMLSGYLSTLEQQNPEMVGGQLPDDDFYYAR
ncbi:ABC transporter substrate-binding protein [Blautia glucerasea]|uniref:ABC transporter substrate-binding protein n=1 Tax=Blautia glucerasea TaxID=536633 RepID=UPI00156E6042|nr:ABC transporter substrate-binding protein [Blautia glucerasea]NSJ27846.1 ABC transporter substrate-binding protein [Blautia glucerasea]